MAQGFMVTALSKAVSTPSSWARSIICWVAGSTEAATGSASLGAFSTVDFFSTAIRRASLGWLMSFMGNDIFAVNGLL
jgi:hypothetical protein